MNPLNMRVNLRLLLTSHGEMVDGHLSWRAIIFEFHMHFTLQGLRQMFCVGSHCCSTILAHMFTLRSYDFECKHSQMFL